MKVYHEYNHLLRFLIYVIITIVATYYLPSIFTAFWYILLLFIYWKSADEPFWLAFFLVTVDGFLGYFGVYTVVIRLIPGLPAIEVAQFYILLSVLKARKTANEPYVFYKNYLWILFFYIIFMVIWGQLMGFSGEINAYFRIAKLTFPFFLFYSIPKLFPDIASFRRFFDLLFLILIAAFVSQVFTLLTGLAPARAFELTAEQVSEAGEYRGFYNVAATLLGLFGALFFLASKADKSFNQIYLYIIIFSAYGMAYLSATRGWMIGFSFTIILTMVLITGTNTRRILGFVFVGTLIIWAGLSNEGIRKQIDYSTERLKTLEAVAEGDITAKGTLSRIETRGPKVMKIFYENPVFGWGFSDTAREYSDGHVGNQNLLLISGILGFTFLSGFLVYFSIKIILVYFKFKKRTKFSEGVPIIVIFLIGWFIIHSTSGQHFNYMGIPAQIIPQAVFFSFGALVYKNVIMEAHGQEIS